jgi:hypothetical protein
MKKLTGLFIIPAMVLIMAACGGSGPPSQPGAADEPGGAVSDEPRVELTEEMPPGPTRGSIPEIVFLVDIQNGYNIIQIPQLEWEGEAPDTGLAFNKQILDFAEGYEEYVDGHPEGYFCEIKAYCIQYSGVFQILMTKAFYPSYGSYGEAAAFYYDCIKQKIVDERDIFPDADTAAVEAEMKAGAYLDEGFYVENVKFINTVLHLGHMIMLYEVTAKSDDGDPWVYLYAYNIDEGTIMDGEAFLSGFAETIAEGLNS